jgi:hypothetical protein
MKTVFCVDWLRVDEEALAARSLAECQELEFCMKTVFFVDQLRVDEDEEV